MGHFQIRDRAHQGVKTIVSVCRKLTENESTLCRGLRTIANMAHDPQNAILLHAEGVANVLIECLASASEDKTKQVIVRGVRLLSSTPEHKRRFADASALRFIAPLLSTGDEDLLKAVLKCLAHFTHGCDAETATQMQGDDGTGFQRLVGLVEHSSRSVWESVVSVIVNLTHQGRLRPALGNAGAIAALIKKVRNSTKRVF